MKKLISLIIAAFMTTSLVSIGLGSSVSESATNITLAPQEVAMAERKTKNATKKTYRKGKYVTKRVYRNGKLVSIRVWQKGASGTRWTAHKTKRGVKTVFRKVKNAVN